MFYRPTPLENIPTTVKSFIPPFRGFSGNVRQKTILEKLLDDERDPNDLPRQLGTDVNDDHHLISFNKKKGNLTSNGNVKVR